MAVHVPLSEEAQLEARSFMSANKNILKPGNGSPVIAMTQDIVLGCYWMTKEVAGSTGEGKWFASPNEAISAYDYGVVDFRAKIKVLGTDSPKYAQFAGKIFDTTVGRLLFNSVLPKEYPYLNEEMKKSRLVHLLNLRTLPVPVLPGRLMTLKLRRKKRELSQRQRRRFLLSVRSTRKVSFLAQSAHG
jgi:DNA-directed RNA polymerase subunit beta'